MADTVQVRMLASRLNYTAGQVASFVPALAAFLVRDGAAEYLTPPKSMVNTNTRGRRDKMLRSVGGNK